MTIKLGNLSAIAKDYAAAWSSESPAAVGAHYAVAGQIIINRGEPLVGRQAVTEMAAGFMSNFPNLALSCDDIRSSGTHALFAWTLTGHHVQSKNYVKISGWEEWELDEDLKVLASLAWFDADDYERQIGGGAG